METKIVPIPLQGRRGYKNYDSQFARSVFCEEYEYGPRTGSNGILFEKNGLKDRRMGWCDAAMWPRSCAMSSCEVVELREPHRLNESRLHDSKSVDVYHVL